MRVTLLGHASVLVEAGPMRILMDPVLRDPFEAGMVTSCPKREIDVAGLLPLDVVVVSHRHADHFDLPSLDLLPRASQVVCADDPLLVYALRALGFSHVTPMTPGGPLRGEHAELWPTRSESRAVRECGLVVRDPSGVFWNQVDTELSGETIEGLLRSCGRVDLLFAMYASQDFAFFDSLHSRFPAETHHRNLDVVLAIGPRLAVPASAGFRFTDEHAWLNRFLFPISRERFVEDLARLDSTLGTAVLDPGDAVVLEEGSDARVERASCPFARTVDADTEAIRFDPTAPIPPLTDPNPLGLETGAMRRRIGRFLEDEFLRYCAAAARDPASSPARHREAGAVYAVEVVLPDDCATWTVDFGCEPPSLSRRRDPRTNVMHRIAASALVGWIERRLGWFTVRAYSRRSSTLYRVARVDGRTTLTPLALPDLLMEYLVYAAPDSAGAARRRIDQEIAELRR